MSILHRSVTALLATAVAASAAWVAAGSTSPAAVARAVAAPVPVPPQTRYVDVTVATAWVTPGDARPGIDAPAVSNPADPRGWTTSMSDQQKLALNPLLETQARYGTPVTVDQTTTVDGVVWDHVWIAGQPTPRDTAKRGAYPGWIPDRQLTAAVPPATGRTIRVTATTAWAYPTPQQAVAHRSPGVAEFSFNTTVPLVSSGPGWVQGLDNRHRPLFFRRADVTTSPPTRPTGLALVTRAKQFLGLPYLWAGTSGFGFDCSGFTHELFASFGVTIPRDAAAQFDAAHGAVPPGSIAMTPVPTMDQLRIGDLVFFRNTGGKIHHVGVVSEIRDGHPIMIHSPRTGTTIREDAIDNGTWAAEFAGGGRYVP
jgi:cell wall-associated NlpC family hydrolase